MICTPMFGFSPSVHEAISVLLRVAEKEHLQVASHSLVTALTHSATIEILSGMCTAVVLVGRLHVDLRQQASALCRAL